MENETFFSNRGRLRRSHYILRALLLSIIAAFMQVVAESSQEPPLLFFSAIIMIACGILIAIQAVKRLHDINMSGWYWLIFLIPIANLIFGLYVIFADGTPGPNRYGEDPKGRQNLTTTPP